MSKLIEDLVKKLVTNDIPHIYEKLGGLEAWSKFHRKQNCVIIGGLITVIVALLLTR